MYCSISLLPEMLAVIMFSGIGRNWLFLKTQMITWLFNVIRSILTHLILVAQQPSADFNSMPSYPPTYNVWYSGIHAVFFFMYTCYMSNKNVLFVALAFVVCKLIGLNEVSLNWDLRCRFINSFLMEEFLCWYEG